jgi:GMP synthase (glutamine-hydrolysing)
VKKQNIRSAYDVYFLVFVQLLVSGGVDSTVCAALLHKALCEDQVIAVHIDNGFMRKNESQRVEQSLEKLGLRVKGSVWLP